MQIRISSRKENKRVNETNNKMALISTWNECSSISVLLKEAFNGESWLQSSTIKYNSP